MSFAYTPFKAANMRKEIDFVNDDIRVALLKLKADTSCDTEKDMATLAGFATLGEIVATNYARKPINTQAVTEDDPNDLAYFSGASITWAALGGAANDTIGAILLFKFVTNDADSIPIAYIDNGGVDFSLTTNGGDVTLNWNAAGILQET